MKQLSIFLENRGGTLVRVLELLSAAGIQIIASSVADTQDYGLYRLLCDQPLKASEILKAGGINFQLTEVIAVSIDDEPGRAANAVRALSEAGVSILYLYSFLWQGRGVLVFRVDSPEAAQAVIAREKMTCPEFLNSIRRIRSRCFRRGCGR